MQVNTFGQHECQYRRNNKNCPTGLNFQATQPKDKIISHETPGRMWKAVRGDTFKCNNKYYLCIVDYHGKLPVIKQVEGLGIDKLLKTCKIVPLEYRLPNKIVQDAGTNFVSEKFENFCKKPGI